MNWWSDWVLPEQGRFFLLLPVAMAAAILVYFDLRAEPPLWAGGGLVAGALAGVEGMVGSVREG